MTMHEYLYCDPKQVHRARVQAEGRIAARRLAVLFWENKWKVGAVWIGSACVLAVVAGVLTGWR